MDFEPFERIPLNSGVGDDGPEAERLKARLGDLSNCHAIVDAGCVRPSDEQLAKTVNNVLDDLESRMATAVPFPVDVMATFALHLLGNEELMKKASLLGTPQIQSEIPDLILDGELNIIFITQLFDPVSEAALLGGTVPAGYEFIQPIDMETLQDVLAFVAKSVAYVEKRQDDLESELYDGVKAASRTIWDAIESLRSTYPQLPVRTVVRTVH